MRNNLKFQLYTHCLDFIETRYKTLQNSITEIQEALQSETKSSAGDEYETGRAMLQLENEKLGYQMVEIKNTKETLKKIDASKISSAVGLGSIVYTTRNNYFISISVGQIILEGNIFYAISVNSPMGQVLLHKVAGDTLAFREEAFTIIQVI